MNIYKILAFDEKQEIDSIAGKGEKLTNAATVHVIAKDEKEAVHKAKTLLTRKEYQVAEVLENQLVATENATKRRHHEYLEKITKIHDDAMKHIDKSHKDFVQLASKANVLNERIAIALEKQIPKKSK